MKSFFQKIIGADGEVRPPRFSGSWYPSDSSKLEKDLATYVSNAYPKKNDIVKTIPKGKTNILAIIAPHAGYAFSGKTAAFAYGLLDAKKYKRVFLLGPSHHMAFKGVVLPSQSFLGTPLGDLAIDKTTVEKLLAKPYFNTSDNVFDTEHSLEMQLPWIKRALGKVKILPMAVGQVSAIEIKAIAETLKNELTDSDLVVVSSDFTHYGPRFGYEPFIDEHDASALSAQIKNLDMQAYDCIKTYDSEILLDFYKRTGDTICGIYPVAILLSLLPAGTDTELIQYSTSQDISNDPDGNSVSYMAIGAFSKYTGWKSAYKNIRNETYSPKQLSAEEGKKILQLARLVLKDYLEGKTRDPLDYLCQLGIQKDEHFLEKRGVFVTLYEKPANNSSNEHKKLRGCIGYIYPAKALFEGVCENSINAASNDPRFSPVALSELNDLIIEVNVLSAPQSIRDWKDIVIGKDGIVMHKSGRQSVFLPKVATEFGWDLPETLSQLSLKAGLSLYDWQKDAQFETFQSQVFSE